MQICKTAQEFLDISGFSRYHARSGKTGTQSGDGFVRLGCSVRKKSAVRARVRCFRSQVSQRVLQHPMYWARVSVPHNFSDVLQWVTAEYILATAFDWIPGASRLMTSQKHAVRKINDLGYKKLQCSLNVKRSLKFCTMSKNHFGP